MSLATRLKEARVRTKKSLQDVADEVGASKAHVWELETGRAKNPSIEMLTKLAKSLGSSVRDLIGENPEGEDENPEIVTMYRDLKGLTDADRIAIQAMIDHLKNRKG
jgi:transcriptional regulator with XRE-family HTH domain